MNHSEKLAQWHAYAKEKNIKKSMYRPPIDIIIQKLGIESPPLILWSTFSSFLMYAISFGVTWGLCMYFFSSILYAHKYLSVLIVGSIAAGILFGATMSIYIRTTKRLLNLPKWEDFK